MKKESILKEIAKCDELRELPQLGYAEVLASCFIINSFPEGNSYIDSTKASSLPEYSKDNAFIYFSLPIHPQPNCDSGCGLLGDEVNNGRWKNWK